MYIVLHATEKPTKNISQRSFLNQRINIIIYFMFASNSNLLVEMISKTIFRSFFSTSWKSCFVFDVYFNLKDQISSLLFRV